MTSDKRDKGPHPIPIRFTDADEEPVSHPDYEELISDSDLNMEEDEEESADEPDTPEGAGGPVTAELIATRAELKRVETENAELKDRFARRQADFENYRKRVERERSET